MTYMATKSEKQLDKLAEEILSEKKTATKKSKNFCETYLKAKPFIQKGQALLSLVKPSWGNVLKDLMESLDEACPVAQG
jgi:hypothetical protein